MIYNDEKKTPLPGENDIGFLIKQIHNDIDRIINNQLRPMDLTSTQAMILTYLSDHENSRVTMTDIQKALGVAHPTVVGLIKRLDKKGLIEVSIAADDRRMKYVRLTEKGKDMLLEFPPRVEGIESLLLKGLTYEECRELRRMLAVLHRNVQ